MCSSSDCNNFFDGFLLLREPKFDFDFFRYHLKKRWDLKIEENFPKNCENFIDSFSIDDIIVSVELINEPISSEKIEVSARNNLFWPEALDMAKLHRAYLHISVESCKGLPLMDLSEFLVKILSACCDDENVLGVFSEFSIIEPGLYSRVAELINDEVFPVANLVYFGAYRSKNGICAYTCGMDRFNKKNLEIVDSKQDLQSVMEFLQDIASYVITSDVEFKSRESVGLNENRLYEIYLSKGVALPEEETFKIDYH